MHVKTSYYRRGTSHPIRSCIGPHRFACISIYTRQDRTLDKMESISVPQGPTCTDQQPPSIFVVIQSSVRRKLIQEKTK